MKKKSILCILPLVTCLAGCGASEPKEAADKIIYGNILTMDEKDSTAEAVAIKDGKIQKVASKKGDINSVKGSKTVEVDYGKDSYIYPGFIEGHAHTMFAGYRSIGQANVNDVIPANPSEYKKIIGKFISDHPEKDMYLVAGWVEDNNPEICKALLDEICPTKPLVLNTCGGHSILCNTKALEHFGVDKAFADEKGHDLVHVDKDGNPDGYICENPAIEILKGFPLTVNDAKSYIEDFQNFAFKNGYTSVVDAGTELMSKNALQAHVELQNEGKLKLRTYSYMMVEDNVDNPKARIEEIVDFRNKNSGEYFNVVGAKVFLDGVLEARTSWLVDDYKDVKEGEHYHGLERFNNKAKMVELITEASKNNLAVHSHSEGDGATKYFLECIEESQKTTNNKDQRNVAAHLHFVRAEEFQKFADTNTIAVVPPTWTPRISVTAEKEIGYVGEEKYGQSYPIKSFIDKGIKTVFHTDYPVSPSFSAPMSVYSAAERCLPAFIGEMGGPKSVNNPTEKISRKQALKAMTVDAAYMVHQEDRLGSIEVGKIANFSIFDTDLVNSNVDYLPFASAIATIVDGEEVYRAEEINFIEVLANVYMLIMELIYNPKYDWDDDPYWTELIFGD